MPEKLEHLELPIVTDVFPRKPKHGGPYSINPHHVDSFYSDQIQQIDKISKKFREDTTKIRNLIGADFKQEMVFKINTDPKYSVSDEVFRKELQSAGLKTVSSATSKLGYWIVSSEDPTLEKYKIKLEQRKNKLEPKNGNFIDAIDKVEELKTEDKIGDLLKEKPLGEAEKAFLDVNIDRDEDENDDDLQAFIVKVVRLGSTYGCEITDKLITKNLCILRLEANRNFLEDLMKIQKILLIDRPPRYHLEKLTVSKYEELNAQGRPDDNAHSILIADSGVRKHPLLIDALQNEYPETVVTRKVIDGEVYDTYGFHGTEVAGIALYGDVEECANRKEFKPEIWICSARIMYENDTDVRYDERELLESLLKKSIEETIKKYPKCRVVNLSIGNDAKVMWKNQPQFNLAALIDDLALEFKNIIFVVAVGNIKSEVYQQQEYPKYLLKETKDVKIIDPATSAHAITVGALSSLNSSNDMPSDLTRVGPGLNGMIKPELVENGGGFNEILTTNPEWVRQGRLFTLTSGTSLSTPRISHYLAKLMNKFPSAGRNLIKAYLLSSAEIPTEIPKPIPQITSKTKSDEWMKILSIYGYGKPNLENALYSDNHRVIFKHEGTVGLDKVQYFTIDLPEEFVLLKGKKEITITLVYDPPIRKSRQDYLSVTLECHLFKNKSVQDVIDAYSALKKVDNGEGKLVPESLLKNEITLKPGVTLRKRGLHQKSIRKFNQKFKLNIKDPLVLAVVCQKRWNVKNYTKQPFAVVMTIKHSTLVDLYARLKLRNRGRARLR